MVAIPSEVFFISAISVGSALIRRAAALRRPVIGRQPLVVMQAAEARAIFGESVHGFRCRTAKRRHRRVVQVDQVIAHRELRVRTAPKAANPLQNLDQL